MEQTGTIRNKLGLDGRIGLAVFVAALVVRMVYICESAKSPLFDTPVLDSYTYCKIALSHINEGTMGPAFFWQGSFYPLYLARILYFAGPSILAAKIAQAIIGSVLCVLVYRIGLKIYNRKAAVWAAAITVFYGPVIFLETELLSTGWECLWAAILILMFLYAAEKTASWKLRFATGVCAGLSIITRATFVPFCTAACVWLFFAMRNAEVPPKKAVGGVLIYILGSAAVLLPFSALAYYETEKFTPLPGSTAVNLYIGNNPNSDETINARPGSQWRHLTYEIPRSQGIIDSCEAADFFMQQFRGYVTKEPASFLKGLLKKTVQFFTSREIPRNLDMYIFRDYSMLFSVLVWKIGGFGFPFGLLFPLAIIGYVRNFRKNPALVILFIVLYSSAVILVFVSARYRAPVIPIMALPAGAALAAISADIKAKNWLKMAASIIFITVVAFFTSIHGPFPAEKTDYRAEMQYLVGFQFLDDNNLEKASEHLRQAVKLNPSLADAHQALGRTLQKQNKPEMAIEQFDIALDIDPNSYLTRYYLADALLDTGQKTQAVKELERSLKAAQAVGGFSVVRNIRQKLENLKTSEN